MWKRFGGLSVIFFLIFLLTCAGTAAGACGVDPPLPLENLIWPADGDVVRPWSLDCLSDTGHRGIDISAPNGVNVKAAASGFVSFTGYTPAEGGGITVTIDHQGGLRSTYLHLKAASVSKGQYVRQGDAIGFTDGSPLHFGIKLPHGSHDTYFNPLDLLPPSAASVSEPAQPELTEASRTVLAAETSQNFPPALVPATIPLETSQSVSLAGSTPPEILPGEASLPGPSFPKMSSPESAILSMNQPVGTPAGISSHGPAGSDGYPPETDAIPQANSTKNHLNTPLFTTSVPVISRLHAANEPAGYESERKPARRAAIGFAVLLISAVATAGARFFNRESRAGQASGCDGVAALVPESMETRSPMKTR